MGQVTSLDALVRALDERPAVLVIDLLGVDCLASAGMAVLIEAHQLAAERTRFRVVAAGTVTLRPLHVTGLDVYTTRHDALHAE